MSVRVRGIYATALTARLDDVVQASGPIQRRFDDEFEIAPADAAVETTDDRQGVGMFGDADTVSDLTTDLRAVGRDTLAWRANLPRGAVFAGEVIETLGSGAIVECGGVRTGDTTGTGGPDVGDETDVIPLARGETTGFLPYSVTARHVEDGDRLRVQVRDPCPPWSARRPGLDTDIRVEGGLAALVRGGGVTSEGPELADILPTEPPDGWKPDWAPVADEAGLEALTGALDALTERARAVDDAFAGAVAPDKAAPHCYWPGTATCWVWFGRASRFALDSIRRDVTTTMTGHHRVKAGTDRASAAVDFVEGVCTDPEDGEFPFDTLTRQFGPREDHTVDIVHGKPDGRRIELGSGTVTDRTPDGEIRVRRELSGSGTYDGLGTERSPGDVAVTKFKEGRWWYPTVYRGEDGSSKGTYVNVCTPVEIFPKAVRYVDLHVDVVRLPDGGVERLDDDELDGAVESGTLTPELGKKARNVADAVKNALRG